MALRLIAGGFLIALGTGLLRSQDPLPGTDPLSGTDPLTETRPLDQVMVAGIDRFALAELAAARASRSGPDAESRLEFQQLMGAIDPRVQPPIVELMASTRQPSRIAGNERFTVDAVRWPALAGVHAEGLWLRPTRDPIARVIAIPDADWTPEMIAGLQPSPSTFAADLASLGCEVLVPALINRDFRFSANPEIGRATNLSHREFIYRQAFEVGRHVIGYEVQKVLAAVDYFAARHRQEPAVPIVVAGVSEGGLLALYSTAIDPRIDASVVSGYFNQRQRVWQEPIYRNVWKLLTKFGDAELANLVAPRSLFIETSPRIPTVVQPAAANRQVAAPGLILSPDPQSVTSEVNRARNLWSKRPGVDADGDHWLHVLANDGQDPLSSQTIAAVLATIIQRPTGKVAGPAVELHAGIELAADARQQRQIRELVSFTQRLLRTSHRVRDQRFAKLDRSSVDAFQRSSEALRTQVHDELIGRLPTPTVDPHPRSRQILETDHFVGYEVVLDVYSDVIAAGVLLLPKGMSESEQRPVVVCQHGLEGTPMDTISADPQRGYRAYKSFSAELAKRGFIVYAPQNPYRGEDKFRTLQRKSNPLGRSLFSYIIPQHRVTLRWLASLPHVDRDRIGFYGLSYGGKTAMRVPPFLVPTAAEPGYCLSICSADFNEWVSKNASVDLPFSYVWTPEYEIFEWNMAHLANYAELAMLISPRPFMVERGHDDGVGLDEWVAWEYAKVRRHYNKLGIGGRTEIEFFDGPHTINGQGTFRFLHRHLAWPRR